MKSKNPNANIKAERARKGFTQKDMAKFLGISENSYQFKEAGKREFTLDEFRILCKRLECSPDYLLNDAS